MRLHGKVALIAGAGGGMGTAVPLLFAQEGARIVLAARRIQPLEQLVSRIREMGGTASAVSGDLTTTEGALHAVQHAEAVFGGVDVIYNNMGDSAARGLRLHETSEEDWDYLTRINLRPAYVLTHAAVPAMQRRGRGVIIHVSASADIRERAHGGYGALKAGLIALTENTARTYRKDNIRIVCLCPHAMGNDFDANTVSLPRHELDRAGTPEDAAWAALFLASDEAAWITGAALAVDGAGTRA